MFFISSKYQRIDPLMKEYILQSTNESIKKKLEYLNKNKYRDILTFDINTNKNEIYSVTKNNYFNLIPFFLFGAYWYFI